MEKIGLFYGSDTGQTEEVANYIVDKMGRNLVEIHDIATTKPSDFDKYKKIILGLSTWFDGDLQSDWEVFYKDHFKKINFTGKKIAIFGLGDQYGYADYFVDGIGILAETVVENGGELIGLWPTEGYEHNQSKAELEGGFFAGLALDQDNQADLTYPRVDKWIAQITREFGLAA